MVEIGAPLRWVRSDRGRRWMRYSAVSVVTVLVGQVVLAVAFGALGWTARSANYLGFVLAGGLSYWLNRSWTWGKRGRSHFLREVIPFWVLALAGLALSTWAVGAAEAAASRLGSARGVATVLVMGASLAATGMVWVVKFVVFDRVLFAPLPHSPADPPLARMPVPAPRADQGEMA